MMQSRSVRIFRPLGGQWAALAVGIACAVCSGSVAVGELTQTGQVGDADRDASADADMQRLIAELGADDYRTREAATEALIDLGPAAASSVEEAAKSPVLEVRTRAERILSIVSRESFERDIEAFVADVDGRAGTTLPGWERARARLGDTRDARHLYAQMYRAEPALFAAYGPDDDASAATSFNLRVDELHDAHLGRNRIHYRLRDKLQQAISTNMMALLFVGADRDLELSPTSVLKFRSIFMQSWPPARVQAAAERDYLRDWLATWIMHRFSLNQREYEAILLGMRYEVPQTLELALRVLDRRENQHSVMYAALCVGKYGEEWHLPRLESLLDNASVVAEPHHRVDNRAVQYKVQLRDMALYVLLSRTGQDPQEYGFLELNPNTEYLYLSQSVAFDGDETRERALAKWHAWRQQNQLIEGEPPSPHVAELPTEVGETPDLEQEAENAE